MLFIFLSYIIVEIIIYLSKFSIQLNIIFKLKTIPTYSYCIDVLANVYFVFAEKPMFTLSIAPTLPVYHAFMNTSRLYIL
jgi:hypothetical protein